MGRNGVRLAFLALSSAVAVPLAADSRASTACPSAHEVSTESAQASSRGDHDDAIGLLKHALTCLAAPADIALVQTLLGQEYMEHPDPRDWAAARDAFGAALEGAEHLPSRVVETLWNNLATTTFQVGDYEEVVRVVERWHRRFPEPKASSWYALSMAHFQMRDYGSALDALRAHAAAVRRDGVRVSSRVGGSLRWLEYTVDDMQRMPELAGPDTRATLAEANELISTGAPTAARPVLKRALTTPGIDAVDAAFLREKLAWMHDMSGEGQTAREMYAALLSDPETVPPSVSERALLRLAALAYDAEDYREAADMAEQWRSRVASPSDSAQRRYLGIAALSHLKLGTGDAAALGEDYLAALDQDAEEPSSEFVELWEARSR